MFTFSVLERKYPFWANLVQKNKNCQSILKFSIQTILNMQNLMVVFHFSDSDFLTGITFLVKFGPKNQNCLLKLKCSIQTILNMKNSMVTLNLSVLASKYPFFGKFDPKIKSCLFKLKIGSQTNSNMQKLMERFT